MRPRRQAKCPKMSPHPCHVLCRISVPDKIRPVPKPAAWSAAEMQKARSEWEVCLSEADIAEVEAALAAAMATGKAINVSHTAV